MKLLRGQDLWWFAILLLLLVAHGSAITLLEVLQTYPQLSTLSSLVNASSNATSLLANATDFTFLAPSNSAIQSYNGANANNTLTGDLFEANLQYSLLQGGYSTLSFSNTSQFVTSHLTNTSYTNVTGGQVVDLVLDYYGTPSAVTGNKNTSTSTSADIVCVGGIIHIIDELLAIPASAVLEITAANLEYFISILSIGNYLSTADTYVNQVLDIPNVTFFIPNSADALAAATALSQNTSTAQEQTLFQYHIVPDFIGYSTLLKDGMQLKTSQGSNITVTIQDGDTYINSARVTSFDYLIANGVVHVIDELLNPADPSLPPKPTSAATSTSAPSSTSTSNSATATPNQSSKHKSHGSTIGIAVGVTLGGLLVLAVLIWFFLRSRRLERDRKSRAEESPNMQDVIHTGLGPFYMDRGQRQRQDMGLGLQTKELQNGQGSYVKDRGSASSPPAVSPRSPSRQVQGSQF